MTPAALLVTSELVAGAAGVIVAGILFEFIRRRRDVAFPRTFLTLALFVLAMAAAQLLDAFDPANVATRAAALVVKPAAAALAVVAAVVLTRMLPEGLRLPSPADLREANDELRRHIAERERLASDARAREMLNRAVLDATADAILTLDEAGRVRLSNRAASELFAPDDAPLVDRPVGALFVDLEPEMLEPESAGREHRLTARREDGGTFPASLRAFETRIAGARLRVCVVQDVSERVHAEAERRELQGRLERQARLLDQVLAAVPDPILLRDRGGTYTYANPAAGRSLETPPEEIVGRSVTELRLPGEQGAVLDEALRHVLDSGEPFVGQFTTEQSHGEVHVYRCVVNPLKDEKGEVTSVLSMSHDVTDLARAKEDLGAVANELRHALVAEQASRARAETLLAAVGETVDRVASATRQIVEAVAQQRAAAEAQAQAITVALATMTDLFDQAVSAAERARAVADSARRVDELGRAGRRAVDDSIAAMAAVSDHAESISETILALTDQAQAIGEIMGAITEIVEQADLLALNAAIESSRVGQHGRGFGVLAGELGALSELVRKRTAQVRQILGDVQHATELAAQASEDGSRSVNTAMKVVGEAGETIKSLAELLEEATQMAGQIAAAVKQQAATIRDLRGAMDHVGAATDRQRELAHQVEHAVGDLDAHAASLKERATRTGCASPALS